VSISSAKSIGSRNCSITSQFFKVNLRQMRDKIPPHAAILLVRLSLLSNPTFSLQLELILSTTFNNQTPFETIYRRQGDFGIGVSSEAGTEGTFSSYFSLQFFPFPFLEAFLFVCPQLLHRLYPTLLS